MYKETEFESKQGVKSIPVVNDVDALHIFTNINKPVDFAGRLVYNDNDEVCFNFGKHKGKTTAQVFSVEPSYYAWMKQGDFPLYTKKKLDEEWAKFNAKKNENKAARPQNNGPANKPQYQQKPQPKQEKPAQPINTDMLEQLKMKFGK
jgi:DNA polymerase-3 subunit epsilon